MAALHTANRAMFWRIIRRLFGANPGRLFVMLLALGAGAAVTAALLNLQVDAKRRLTTEFRALGANIVVTPKSTDDSMLRASTLPDTVYDEVPTIPITVGGKSALLFSIGEIRSYTVRRQIPVVIVGVRQEGFTSERIGLFQEVSNSVSKEEPYCIVGSKVAAQAGVHAYDRLFLREKESELSCHITAVEAPGSENDSNVVVRLTVAQRLTGLDNRISLVRVSFPGTPTQINDLIASLSRRIPDADVHGIRQFTEGEAKIYNRISGLLTATVAIGPLRDGGDDQRGDGAEDGRWPDEGHRRLDAPRAAAFPGGGGAAGPCRRDDWGGGRNFSLDRFRQSGIWRSGAAAADCVSCGCGAHYHRRDS